MRNIVGEEAIILEPIRMDKADLKKIRKTHYLWISAHFILTWTRVNVTVNFNRKNLVLRVDKINKNKSQVCNKFYQLNICSEYNKCMQIG